MLSKRTFLQGSLVAGAACVVPGTGSAQITDLGSPADNAAAILAACQALAVGGNGGKVLLPPTTIPITSLDISGCPGVEIWGETRYSSVLKTVNPIGDVVILGGIDQAVRHLSILSDAPRTSGRNLVMSQSRAVCEDVFINNHFIGIEMTGGRNQILSTLVTKAAAGGTHIRVGGGDTSSLIDNTICGAQAGAQPFAGIDVYNAAAVKISNTDVLTSGRSLLVAPGAGQDVSHLKVSNSFFDSGMYGAYIHPTNGGTVSNIDLFETWLGGRRGYSWSGG